MFKFYISFLNNQFVKGDTIVMNCSLREDITDWKIRCEVYDDHGSEVQLGNTEAGGSDSQINVTSDANGEFTITVPKDQTDCFEDRFYIEIEIEKTDGTVFTVHRELYRFKPEEITWTTPDS